MGKKDMFEEKTGKFTSDDSTSTRKEAKIDAKKGIPHLVVNGQSKSLSPKANKVFSIGRDKSNAVIIADPKASRHHAIIKFEGGEGFIEDTNSSNGTYINGEKLLPNRKTKLNNGDKIKIGRTVLVFYI